MPRKSNRNWLRAVLLCVFGALFCVSLFMVVRELAESRHSAETFEKLRQMTSQAGQSSPEVTAPPRATPAPPESVPPAEPTPTPEEQARAELLAAYAAIREENPDFYGWIRVEGTRVDYPVMYTPDDPEHYLRRAFDGSHSAGGVPFLDAGCYEGCGNYIVYGHRMKNGTMFEDLSQYADRSFWESHPTLRFDTLDGGVGEYEVVAAFYGRVYGKQDDGVFRYYQYSDLTDPAVFEEFVSGVEAAALYDTGVEVSYGDQLLTLSTCSYHTTDGRFAVVARKIAG